MIAPTTGTVIALAQPNIISACESPSRGMARGDMPCRRQCSAACNCLERPGVVSPKLTTQRFPARRKHGDLPSSLSWARVFLGSRSTCVNEAQMHIVRLIKRYNGLRVRCIYGVLLEWPQRPRTSQETCCRSKMASIAVSSVCTWVAGLAASPLCLRWASLATRCLQCIGGEALSKHPTSGGLTSDSPRCRCDAWIVPRKTNPHRTPSKPTPLGASCATFSRCDLKGCVACRGVGFSSLQHFPR